MRVELSDEADTQVTKIDAWWQENRLAAPGLFSAELDRALVNLGETPTPGTPYRAGSPTLRRLLLRRTHYHIYFIEEPDRIYVVAVWSSFRGRTPRL